MTEEKVKYVGGIDADFDAGILRSLIKSYSIKNAASSDCSEYAIIINNLKVTLYTHEARLWRRKYFKVKEGEEHDSSFPVPFYASEILDYPIDEKGNIVVPIPEIKNDIWYKHEDGRTRPDVPAAYADGETQIDIYDRLDGVHYGIKVKDVDWTTVKQYRKSETVVTDDVEEFGMF